MDLVQEIFIKLFNNISRFNEAMPFHPWIRRIAINTCINYKRDRKSNVISLNSKINDELSYVGSFSWLFRCVRFNLMTEEDKPKVFKIRGVYGLEDPSVTGFINSFLCIIKGVIPNECIELNAIYDDEIIDIDIIAEGDLKLFIIGFRSLKPILKRENRKIIFKKRNLLKHFDI